MLWAKAAASGGVTSAGTSGLLGLLLLMEIGVPIPIPADLLMIVLGERVSAGALPLGPVVVALELVAIVGTVILFAIARGPGRAVLERFGARIGLTEDRLKRAHSIVETRGAAAVALGRSTPGLRTVTAIAAAGASSARSRLLVALLLGSTLFVQGHFLLGLVLGPPARAFFERATMIAIAFLIALMVCGVVVWARRRSAAGTLQSFSEASCPACIAIAALTHRTQSPE